MYEEAIRAVKAALPGLRNVRHIVASGHVRCTNEHVDKLKETLLPFVMANTIMIQPDTRFEPDPVVNPEVAAGEKRLEAAFENLFGRIEQKASANMARFLHAAADFVEKL